MCMQSSSQSELMLVKIPYFYHCLTPDCFCLPPLPNKQSGKYNKMDPILIGTAVSKHVIREMIKPAVQLVKVLWCTIIFINIHDYVININVRCCWMPKTRFLSEFSLTYRSMPQNASSLLDNFLDIHHFSMW